MAENQKKENALVKDSALGKLEQNLKARNKQVDDLTTMIVDINQKIQLVSRTWHCSSFLKRFELFYYWVI